MRIVLDVPEIPATVMEGHEATGEIRCVYEDDIYLQYDFEWKVSVWLSGNPSADAYVILRKVKPKRWRAEPNKQYEYVQILTFTDYREEKSNMHYESGNYFMPGTAKNSLPKAIDAIAKDIEDEQSE